MAGSNSVDGGPSQNPIVQAYQNAFRGDSAPSDNDLKKIDDAFQKAGEEVQAEALQWFGANCGSSTNCNSVLSHLSTESALAKVRKALNTPPLISSGPVVPKRVAHDFGDTLSPDSRRYTEIKMVFDQIADDFNALEYSPELEIAAESGRKLPQGEITVAVTVSNNGGLPSDVEITKQSSSLHPLIAGNLVALIKKTPFPVSDSDFAKVHAGETMVYRRTFVLIPPKPGHADGGS